MHQSGFGLNLKSAYFKYSNVGKKLLDTNFALVKVQAKGEVVG